MTANHYLHDLFHPKGIAIIGASERAESVGKKVMKNMIASGYHDGLFPVNPKHKSVFDLPCFSSVLAIPAPVSLAVITTPAATVPDILRECGKKQIRMVIIISAGFSEMGEKGKQLENEIKKIANEYGIRFIGPNCLGVMRPSAKLNATFDNNYAEKGQIALLSQSGAICAAILDWAVPRHIGFSTIVSMGNSIDLDFGHMLDYLATDPETKSILLYIEGVHFPREFMSGLRAASRIKPVIALKAGRNSAGGRAVHSHTGALIGNDDVFTAALRRGGAVRVDEIEDLFTAAEILSRQFKVNGDRLTIVTNGGGAGVMAADRSTDLNVELTEIKDSLLTSLNTILPPHWSHQNPVDILGDAEPARYRQVIDACLQDEASDALLAILVPVAMSKPLAVAKEICQFAKKTQKPLIACWMGEKQVQSSWKLFAKNNVPCYHTPEVAVQAFSYLSNYFHNQKLLLQVPDARAIPEEIISELTKKIIADALKVKRKTLTTIESKTVLQEFGIPVSLVKPAKTAEEAAQLADETGYPVVMKINSPDITHKQDVDGVQLNLLDANAVKLAFARMMQKVKTIQPNAKIDGVTIERMYKNADYRELMIGVVHDKVFGPVISFGLGGSLVEVIKDRAIALPPLNKFLAERLINRTKASQVLSEFRGKSPVNKELLIDILLRVSNMVCELPSIQEMDINPLLLDAKEAIVVDARIIVDDVEQQDYAHMAIYPYPKKYMQSFSLQDGTRITIRPIRPEDAKAEQVFVQALSREAKYFRFMQNIDELTPEMLARFTQIDYDREMALVATMTEQSTEKIIGITRYYPVADKRQCEFAIAILDVYQNKGIGTRLIQSLMAIAKEKGVQLLSGRMLPENKAMIHLSNELGFTVKDDAEGKMKYVEKAID